MVTLFLVVALALFVASLHLCKLVPKVKLAVATSREAAAVMRSTALDEEEKEIRVQKAAMELFGTFFTILLGTLVALAVPAAFIALGTVFGLYGLDDAVAAAIDTRFVVGSTAATLAALVLAR